MEATTMRYKENMEKRETDAGKTKVARPNPCNPFKGANPLSERLADARATNAWLNDMERKFALLDAKKDALDANLDKVA